MRIQKLIATSAVWFGLGVPCWVQAQMSADAVRPPTAPAVTYDFAYRATDNRVNVFDDGQVTRIQLPEGTLLPTLVAIQPKGEVLLHPKRDGTYLLLDGIHQQLRLRWANAKDIAVVYSGQSGLAQRMGQAASFGTASPTASFGAAAKPVKASLTPATASPGEQGSVPNLENVAAAAGALATKDQEKPKEQAKAPAFTLNTDQPIHEALTAWAKQAGWHLVWQPDVSWRTLREASFTHLEIVSAVDAVISTLRSEGKPVALRVSDGNKVLEIISTEVRHDQH